ncbi:MAG: hypothetical protein LBP63_01660 [Prevotellaceae bacterium]|jgi:hypothetical protein|nr:hypothetical protein [Prevotellaceae bacterium]
MKKLLLQTIAILLILAGMVACGKEEKETPHITHINGMWKVKAVNILGELTDIGYPPENASFLDMSIEIPNTTQGYINGNTFCNPIGFDFELKGYQISLAQKGLFDEYRVGEDIYGMAFRYHIMFNVAKFNVSNNELIFMDFHDNSIIVFTKKN